MDESRKQFEQTYEQLRKDGQTINLWDVWSMAWQASRAAIEIELPDAADYWNGTEGHEILNHRQLMADSADAIRAAGIKVKE
ncbi:hypothetical protein ACTLKO_001574 [Enterobacter ludwigii]|uniref:hypothetical protein n=1 Tax=Enterobacter ludwigii TaxID=299767 RepID=UPI0035C6B912